MKEQERAGWRAQDPKHAVQSGQRRHVTRLHRSWSPVEGHTRASVHAVRGRRDGSQHTGHGHLSPRGEGLLLAGQGGPRTCVEQRDGRSGTHAAWIHHRASHAHGVSLSGFHRMSTMASRVAPPAPHAGLTRDHCSHAPPTAQAELQARPQQAVGLRLASQRAANGPRDASADSLPPGVPLGGGVGA